ncbi:glycosyltransferase [Psychrobacter sp.]|uniref:glycosyltransferase n=1 Tax=Psychrobacter sp. TaxID=56811 RepID=UPI0025D58B15|nr:glycosyltransferase [Psychrobacter sp.]
MSSLSIIIITLNEAERIGSLLEDLVQQTHRDFEVILVDSNSKDETCTVAQGFANRLPKLHIEQMLTKGVCLGRNTGAELAQHERLLFLDADVRLAPNFIEQALKDLDAKQLQVAGVYMSSKGLPKRYSLGYRLFNLGIGLTQFVFPTAIGACLFSTKTVHNTIQGFDNTITLCEDCDYVNRASRITKFRMLPLGFTFDPRRLKQDGIMTTGRKYLHANFHRLFIGEIRNNKIRYEFDHYKPKSNKGD